MKLHFLGTGAASVKKLYNTCFVIENNNQFMLVDGGGGNQILSLLDQKQIDLDNIHNIFLTHIHTDHILGLVWILRESITNMFFKKLTHNLHVYGEPAAVAYLQNMFENFLPFFKPAIDTRLFFHAVKDGEEKTLIDLDFEFVKMINKKEDQFGFEIKNPRIAFCGDVPLDESLFEKFAGVDYLLHEAFCLAQDNEKNHTIQKGHIDVFGAAKTAQTLACKNLIVFHTIEDYDNERKALFTEEAKKAFDGNVFVPEDLETIEIK